MCDFKFAFCVNLQFQLGKDREAWHVAVHGVAPSDTTLWLNNKAPSQWLCIQNFCKDGPSFTAGWFGGCLLQKKFPLPQETSEHRQSLIWDILEVLITPEISLFLASIWNLKFHDLCFHLFVPLLLYFFFFKSLGVMIMSQAFSRD